MNVDPSTEDLHQLRRRLKACSIAEAIQLLDRPTLEQLGWTVHADRPHVLTAGKTGPEGQLLELTIDRARRTIAGQISNGYEQPPQRHLLLRRIFGVPLPGWQKDEPEVRVRKLRPDGSSEILAVI